ncbi:hypothetical protein M8C21_012492 [Ambrosia artemisiifolia]|uniref:WAT1-related protein n=1 Tax=Ambrosia artemisiifolia TaxID=4212 RepID=A0AAD5BXB3_AMBAR|nr:hypothetical protein M8C21_026887 [Ambrosia artemisiifolia]KAI7731506.1 hypothetical protein M8C21_012492 [Ambrosia artemisiifolia]
MGLLIQALNSAKPYLAMVALQFGYAGMYIITMIGMKRGLSHWILVVYRHASATLVIAPFALAFERPVLDQNLYFLGMSITSATYASAIINVLPALTFVMALIFRMEKVNLKRIHSQAKVFGTVITVIGATVMTLYKGPIVDILWYSHHGASGAHAAANGSSSGQQYLAGTVMVLLCTFSWAGYFILQSMTLKEYPAELSLTMLVCIAGTVEAGIVAMVVERDPKAWALGFDSRLLASLYSGIVCSGIGYYTQGVVNRMRGPVFVTAFSPLCMIITAVLGAIVLNEQVHLGSLLGAIIIVMGLYSVVWGKSKDHLLTLEKGAAHELPTVDKRHLSTFDTMDEPIKVTKKDTSLPQEP